MRQTRWLQLHRLNAVVLGLFLVAHLGNHIFAIRGPAVHIEVMDWLRMVYRQPVFEAVLLASLLGQAVSGTRMLWQAGAWRRKGVGRLQVYSGAYLALFIAIHLAAIIWARWVLGLDTNFYFAAAGLNITPFPVFFVPYYFLAIVAVFAHVACALRRLLRARLTPPQLDKVVFGGIGAGIVIASLVVASFCGLLQPVAIPPVYVATFK